MTVINTVTDKQKSCLLSLVGVLVNLVTDRLDVQYFVKHVEHWLDHDLLCGTLCANRFSNCESQREPSWSILTCMLAVQRRTRNVRAVLVQLGVSVLETSSTTQGAIARGIQLQQFLTDIGCPLPLRVESDSAAARG